MVSLLLALIYVAFISLGLPDSLLGSAWPAMQPSLGVPVSYAGIIAMIIAGGTVVSSLLSERLTKKLGTGLVTASSVLLTAIALFGFSISNSFVLLCLFAVPYGLGAGAVDAALNNFVALHYSSRHMSWLHCFWGVGAAVSPYIMSYFLMGGQSWNNGYRTVSIIQFALTAILFISVPLWKKKGAASETGQSGEKAKSLKEIWAIPGVRYVLLAFFGYCAAEGTAGLWASSYLVMAKGIEREIAAQFASLFYIGITAGRFVCGFVANKLGDRRQIRLGLAVMVLGIFLVWLPVPVSQLSLIGLIVIGVGCAPVYPAIIHATPDNFGKENSQAIIGVQMASAYIGSTFMPPLFGFIAERVSISLYPLYILIFAVLMLGMTEILNKAVRKFRPVPAEVSDEN